jgi:hypothetical protein
MYHINKLLLFKNKAVLALSLALIMCAGILMSMKTANHKGTNPVSAVKKNKRIVTRSTSNFYEYKSSSLLQADIQNINNYEAESDGCSGSTNVCGVTLSTAHTIGSTPVASEFNAEKPNLWLSQENNTAEDGNISMKN